MKGQRMPELDELKTPLPPGTSEQQAQYDDLVKDFTAKLEKLEGLSGQLANVPKLQKDFEGHVADIRKMQDRFSSYQADMEKRFQTILSQAKSGGGALYRGAFDNRQAAEDFGRTIISAAKVARNTATAEDREIYQKAAASAGTGAGGGLLLQNEIVSGIIRNVEQYGVFEANAFVIPTGGQRATSIKRTQGYTCYYPDLGVDATASDFKLGAIISDMTRYVAFAVVDNNMLRYDLAIPLAEFIARELALCIAYATDLNGFMGDGTAAYAKSVGLFKLTTALATGLNVVVADTGDNTFAEVVAKSSYYLAKVLAALPQWAESLGVAWYMSRSIFFEYIGQRDTTGKPLFNMVLENGKPQQSLMGYPTNIVHVGPRMADTANSGRILAAGSLRGAMQLVRSISNVELAFSTEAFFKQDQSAWRVVAPRAIGTHDGSALSILESAAS
jgi:HK97 family phage major capsid protein